MTFEEFFKKKRIDVDALEKGEPALFSEFKKHYTQMGEKSFDHTKKYWFNKIRRQYQLAPEIKTEKPKIENQLAEQTIIESLLEEGNATAAPSPKPAFVPRFKAANIPKPVAEKKPETDSTPPEIPAENKASQPYRPRFSMKNIPPKASEE
jgi:hypothetical protein